MTTKHHEETPLAQPPVRRQSQTQELGDDERGQLLVDRPHDYIERTLPEDRLSDRGGQLTRDNVNPAIPSAEQGQGGIVDPTSLGMEQGGVAAPTAEAGGEAPLGSGTTASINEPPGSTIGANVGGETPPAAEPPDLLDIDPDIATIGDADLTLTCTGEGFTADSVITFNGGDEPTTYVSDTTLTTIVKPSTAGIAGEFPVTVKNAAGESEPLMFEFVEPARAAVAKSRPKKPAKAPKRKK